MSRSSRVLLTVVIVGMVVIVLAAVGLALLLGSDEPMIAGDPQWLHVEADASVVEAPGNEGLLTDPKRLPPLSTELADALRDAATDEQVKGVFLEVGGLSLGWAQLQGLRDALADLQAAGKPCVAWAPALTNKEYFLASACGDLQVAPAGMVFVNGLSITQSYYAGTFEKIGVKANFEHVGDFKSAVEPYSRTGPSDAASEAMNSLLDSLYGQILAGISEGRKISVDEARALLDDPPLTPADALARKMVDKLAWRDEVLAQVLETEDPDEDDLLSLKDYMTQRRNHWSSGENQIAVVYAEGAIVDGEGGDQMFGGQMIGDKDLNEILHDLEEDEDVDAVVLRVNSPGGSGSASDAIWRQMERLKAKKPVVVSMGDYAASGGYYISAGASSIVAEPATLTGSIGVFGGKLVLSGALEKIGVSNYTYERGAYSSLLSPMHDFTDLDRAKFRTFLEAFYQTFLERVSAGRGMSKEAVHAVAQGRVWTGQQALERKLVDSLGGLDDAVNKAAELAGIDRSTASIRRLPERKSFFDQVFSELDGSSSARSPALYTPEVQRAVDTALTLERVLGGGGAAALLPGDLEVR